MKNNIGTTINKIDYDDDSKHNQSKNQKTISLNEDIFHHVSGFMLPNELLACQHLSKDIKHLVHQRVATSKSTIQVKNLFDFINLADYFNLMYRYQTGKRFDTKFASKEIECELSRDQENADNNSLCIYFHKEFTMDVALDKNMMKVIKFTSRIYNVHQLLLKFYRAIGYKDASYKGTFVVDKSKDRCFSYFKTRFENYEHFNWILRNATALHKELVEYKNNENQL